MLSHSIRLLAALSLCVSAQAWAQPAEKQPAQKQPAEKKSARPVKPVSVNGKPIPRARVEFIVKQRTAQGQPDTEQARQAILDNLITQEAVAQEAERRGYGKNAEVRTQLDLLRQQVLVQAMVQDHLKAHPVKDEEMLAEYNKLKASRSDKEYQARHILVDKEAEANEIVAQLKKGTKFDELAKQSKDPGSKDKGGELGWNTPQSFVKPFADALAKLEKGKYTETPVQTQFGWHVIQLDDVRTTQFPSFETVKQQMVSRMQEQEVQKLVREIRGKAKIE
jgi:peptidyl-prolyl cis-trans isomerase C